MRQFERLVELYHSANIRTKYVKNTGCLFDIIVKIDSQIRRHFHCAVTNKQKKETVIQSQSRIGSININLAFLIEFFCFFNTPVIHGRKHIQKEQSNADQADVRAAKRTGNHFLEVFIGQYGSVEELKEALDRRPQKRKRGRPRKVTNKSA